MNKKILAWSILPPLLIIVLIFIGWTILERSTSQESLDYSNNEIKKIIKDYSSLPGLKLVKSQKPTVVCEQYSDTFDIIHNYVCSLQASLLFISDSTTDFSVIEAQIQQRLKSQPFTHAKYPSLEGDNTVTARGMADKMAQGGEWMSVFYGSSDQLQISFRFVGSANSNRLLEVNNYTLQDTEDELPKLVESLSAEQRLKHSILEIDLVNPYSSCESILPCSPTEPST